MYKEDTMIWFADDAENFVNHYYDELRSVYMKTYLKWILVFDYATSEDYFNYHYDQIMGEYDLSDIDRERIWQASFGKRHKQSCEVSK